jgi:parallel beta-helix repeat protein
MGFVRHLHQHSHIRMILAFVLIAALLATLVPPLQAQPVAQADTAELPSVAYDAATNTVDVGTAYTDPRWSAHPSHPEAPKQAISIDELHAQLVQDGYPSLLQQIYPGAWLSTANIRVHQSARLELTAPAMSALLLDSTPGTAEPPYVFLEAEGGHILIRGIRVMSWDTTLNDVDADYSDGRSYLLATHGARMDVIDAEIAYLGWSAGKTSGLAWRQRATQDDIQTGSTGSIINSTVHHLYAGQYSYEAYGLKVDASTFRDNVSYGFDLHNYSTGFTVANSVFHSNGNHAILLSRGCANNVITDNIVYANDGHGMMLNRGSNNNRIANNIVYNNDDGIAISQSSDNLIQQNELYDNNRGVRISASYDNDDPFDGLSINNTVQDNSIRDNAQYGVSLAERADQNVIAGNDISGSEASGISIETGDNSIHGNRITYNGTGIDIYGTPLEPIEVGVTPPLEPLSEPGFNNHIYGNTIEENVEEGIRIREGKYTVIGPRNLAANPQQRNLIRVNGAAGIRLDDATVHTLVQGNLIHYNQEDGVLIRDTRSEFNTISQNSITVNGGLGIQIRNDANGNLAAPEIIDITEGMTLTGTAPLSTTIEVYRDASGEGNTYVGSTQTDAGGEWSYVLAASTNDDEGVSVLAIDEAGNTSEFTHEGTTSTDAVYEIGNDDTTGARTIYIYGEGAVLTLPRILEDLRNIDADHLLEDQGGGVWQANASIFIGRGVTLNITSDTVSWLKLRSQSTDIDLAAAKDYEFNYDSFTSVRVYNGVLLLDGVRVTSWDPLANGGKGDYDRDISNGRSYLLAKYDARMDIINSELSYLGSPDGESYGISWRDTNGSSSDTLRTRVTGDVIDSILSYNYYGIYTYQASYMTFRGNTFHNNISYGFDPHDYTHHVLVEDNESYENGNHGFIISRGCHNFIFRNNRSYNNRYSVDNKDRNAHGFMLDPGSPNSSYPQAPVSDTLLEGNEAWGNDGYGLRVLGSINNTIQNNFFYDNLQGITLEQGSTGNLVQTNTISNSGLYGVYLIGGSDANTISDNQITGSGLHGIYIKTGNNDILGNTLRQNGTVEEDKRNGSGIAMLPEQDRSLALADFQLPGEAPLVSASSDLPGSASLASELTNNHIEQNVVVENIDDGLNIKGSLSATIVDNIIERNGEHGIYLSAYYELGTTNTTITNNTIAANAGQGIRANASETVANTWSENSIFDNAGGGIANTSGANNDIAAPEITSATTTTIAGVAQPGARVEIFSDEQAQGRYVEGFTTADEAGSFQFTTSGEWSGLQLTATSTDTQGNSSEFSATYTISRLQNRDTILHLPLVVR